MYLSSFFIFPKGKRSTVFKNSAKFHVNVAARHKNYWSSSETRQAPFGLTQLLYHSSGKSIDGTPVMWPLAPFCSWGSDSIRAIILTSELCFTSQLLAPLFQYMSHVELTMMCCIIRVALRPLDCTPIIWN